MPGIMRTIERRWPAYSDGRAPAIRTRSSHARSHSRRAAFEATQRMLDRGLVHVVASDAHSLAKRPPSLAAARERVRTDWGEDLETLLFETNPRLFSGLG